VVREESFWQTNHRPSDNEMQGYSIGRMWTDEHLNVELHIDFATISAEFERLARIIKAQTFALQEHLQILLTATARAMQQPLALQRPVEERQNEVKAQALQWAQRNRNVGPGLPPVWMTKVWR